MLYTSVPCRCVVVWVTHFLSATHDAEILVFNASPFFAMINQLPCFLRHHKCKFVTSPTDSWPMLWTIVNICRCSIRFSFFLHKSFNLWDFKFCWLLSISAFIEVRCLWLKPFVSINVVTNNAISIWYPGRVQTSNCLQSMH